MRSDLLIRPQQKNRAGWPGFHSVELRCGYIAARRNLTPRWLVLFVTKHISVGPRVSHRNRETRKQDLEVQTTCRDGISSVPQCKSCKSLIINTLHTS